MTQPHPLKFQDPKIAKLYQDVPAEALERLREFRATQTYKETSIGGDWRYLDVGRGSPTLLVLAGALGTAESGWQTILHFAERGYRVIAPSYPPSITTMNELADGVVGVMDREAIPKAHVLGGSYGGVVAQVFVRRHPERTERLVVSHAGCPDPERGRKIAGALRWLRLLPMALLRAIVRKRLAGLLPEGPAGAMLAAYVAEVLTYQTTKTGLLNGYRRVVDFDLNGSFTPEDLAGWPGRILLIMADDDPSTPEPVRRAMQTLYPQAEVHLFHGTGHAAPILRQEEYYSVLETFFEK